MSMHQFQMAIIRRFSKQMFLVKALISTGFYQYLFIFILIADTAYHMWNFK